jgi:hypothetical protein
MELQNKPKTTLEILEMSTVLGYKELRGLSDPGLRDCAHSIVFSRIRDGALLAIFTIQINLQAHRYCYSFHPGVSRGIISIKEYVYIL